MESKITQFAREIALCLSEIQSVDEQMSALNEVREILHQVSPMKKEPVDFVKWVKNDFVTANDYNPNKVAPPEMKLLELSVLNDGYTQPIVAWPNEDRNKLEVVDGFHRSRVGKESKVINARVNGYLPIVSIKTEQSGKNDRMASTIRHNRARGKHQIDAMSEIVIELKNRNWRNARIAKELGMDEEEVLRLCQISGMEHLFSDKDFSRAWNADDIDESFDPITDQLSEEEIAEHKIPLEKNDSRVFHTYDKWECHKAGFYASKVDGMTSSEAKDAYRDFLSDLVLFKVNGQRVIREWKHSCEHYLTNPAMNRIAWIGQAAMCYATGVPSVFCSGFNLLTKEQQDAANLVALEILNEWERMTGRAESTLEQALSSGRQTELY